MKIDRNFFSPIACCENQAGNCPIVYSEGLYEDAHMPNHFLWVESWASAEALAHYMASDNFRMMMGAIEALGSLQELKEVRYD
jgi:quinol monooxygenase YgiN